MAWTWRFRSIRILNGKAADDRLADYSQETDDQDGYAEDRLADPETQKQKHTEKKLDPGKDSGYPARYRRREEPIGLNHVEKILIRLKDLLSADENKQECQKKS